MKCKVWISLAVLHALGIALVLALASVDTVPVHYGVTGEADVFASKWWYALAGVFPLVELSIYAAYARGPKGAGRQQPNRAQEERTVQLTAIFLAAVGWLFVLLSLFGSGKMDVRLGCAVVAVLGLIMVVLSNFMAKLLPNATVGYRMAWTLKDERVWRETHRFAGFSGTAGGLMMLAGALIGMAGRLEWLLILFIAGLLLVGPAPTLYAYLRYHGLHPKEETK